VNSRFEDVGKVVVAAQGKNLEAETASCYCKLGCILICGTIERSVEILVTERVAGRSVPQVSSFLKSFFKRGTNYDCEEIERLLFRFDNNWGHSFRSYATSNEQVKTSISSCYAVRNSIAHGGSQSLGPRILRQYFDDAFALVVELESILRS
jgi:hypothetical protein